MGGGGLAGDEPGGMQLSGTVGEHGLDQLIVGDGVTRNDRLCGEIQARPR